MTVIQQQAQHPGEPGRSSERRPSRQETRQRVLEAALEVFAERGLTGASVDDVARAAGFTKGAVYSNFATKEDLFFELFAQETSRLLGVVREVVLGIPEGSCLDMNIVDALLDRLIPFGRRWYLINLEFVTYALRNAEGARAFMNHQQRFREEIGQVFSEALARTGRRPTIDPDVLMEITVGVYLDAMGASYVSGSGADSRIAIRAALSALLEALTVPLPDTPA